MLTVLERAGTQDRYCLWRCRCDCGGEILVNTKRLERGTVTNCGCVPKQNARNGSQAEDLTGRVFGRLTVLRRAENKNGRTRWLCRCECGNEKEVSAHELKNGRTRSCGCMAGRAGRSLADITGRRFGRLVALYPSGGRDKKGSVYWHCRCDCGSEVDVTENNLVYGSYRSCGCLKRELQQDITNKLHRVDGTCLEWLEKRKHRRDNTSGFRGVHRRKNGRYFVAIGFKRKRYYVGLYDSFEEAVQARLEAEKTIHEGFLSSYRAWQGLAESDPQWAERHPYRFDVEKVGPGQFRVVTGDYGTASFPSPEKPGKQGPTA